MSCHGKANVYQNQQGEEHPRRQRLVYAFAVDRPLLLSNASEHTIRTIVRHFESNGFLVASLVLTVDGKPVVHVL
jgi:hypothetical protein